MITIDDIRGIKGAALINLGFRSARGVSTDSRSVSRGQIFFALRGERFDGHSYVSDAIGNGAACAVVDRKWHRSLKHAAPQPLVVVDDTTRALGELARIYRRKFDMPVIAVGGSNGKTTTKEMIAGVLSRKYKVAKTTGNHNNQIGVPLTILQFKKSHDAAVVEIGTNHFGEIERLCEILEPDAGLITNIGAEHLEFFGSMSGVGKEEGKLFKFLTRMNGTAFVNLDDKRIFGMSRSTKRRFTYGFQSGARRNMSGRLFGFDSKGCALFEIKFEGRTELVHLNVPGVHNAMNALAAAAVGFRYGVGHAEVKRALETFRSYEKRMQVFRKAGVTILNDTYNSNPESALAALRWMSMVRTNGKRIAVLADMLELGGASKREHQRVGKAVAAENVDYLFTFGSKARDIARAADGKVKAETFYDKGKLSGKLLRMVSSGDVVVVKGSRGMKMEDVVEALMDGLESGRTR
jgi:UDP-N-acetylmuramoyl-tripeptide--D-alanyl-D-alanine ligase